MRAMMDDKVGEWRPIEKWSDCRQLERPGFIFEIQNASGQILLTRCTPHLNVPFDWTSAPVRFRAIPEPAPQRSTPLPPLRR